MKESQINAKIRKARRGIPARLEEVRGDRSERQFARDLGVFQQNVNRYGHGTTPHSDFAIRLAIVEGISPAWLLLGQGRKLLAS